MKPSAQTAIETLLRRLVDDGTERGLQVAAYVEGELAVHAWAGIADSRSGEPVRDNTLFPVFSVSKGVAATVLHRCAERGRVDYDQTIASVWPEFAVREKERVTVRQALNHSAGIPQMPRGIDFHDLGNWQTMCQAIADLTPLYEPGTRIEYHAITYGWIVGEVACRVAGRSFPQLLESELCQPLGVSDDLFIGIPDAVESRVAFLEEPGASVAPDNGLPHAIPVWLGPLHDWMNRADARRACIPASSGIMTAHALARHYAALLPGGADGIELLPPARVRLATEPKPPARPENNDSPKSWGLGYQLGGADSLYGGPSAFGHGGYGGAIGFADPQSRLAVGIVKNHFNQADSTRLIVNELRRAL